MTSSKQRKYGGYSVKQLQEIVASSKELNESVDTLCGGNPATSRMIIDELLTHVEALRIELILEKGNQ